MNALQSLSVRRRMGRLPFAHIDLSRPIRSRRPRIGTRDRIGIFPSLLSVLAAMMAFVPVTSGSRPVTYREGSAPSDTPQRLAERRGTWLQPLELSKWLPTPLARIGTYPPSLLYFSLPSLAALQALALVLSRRPIRATGRPIR